MGLLLRTAVHVGAMRRKVMRWAASRAEREALFTQTGGVFPAPIVHQAAGVEGAGLGLGAGGERAGVAPVAAKGRRPGRRGARLHVMVTVTASMRHPVLGYVSLEALPEGVAPRVVLKTKPESHTNQKGNLNVIAIPVSPQHGPSAAAKSRFPSLCSGQAFAALLPLLRDQNDISRRDGNAAGLRTENFGITTPAFSESDGLEGWIQGVVTRWEKQHGPFPKKEVLPEKRQKS